MKKSQSSLSRAIILGEDLMNSKRLRLDQTFDPARFKLAVNLNFHIRRSHLGDHHLVSRVK